VVRNARPVLVCLRLATAASSPMQAAAPANMTVMDPAGYRFGDCCKLGPPIVEVFLVVAIGLVPLVRPL